MYKCVLILDEKGERQKIPTQKGSATIQKRVVEKLRPVEPRFV